MSTESQRTCPSYGNELSGAMEFCPVCMLRRGLAGGVVSLTINRRLRANVKLPGGDGIEPYTYLPEILRRLPL